MKWAAKRVEREENERARKRKIFLTALTNAEKKGGVKNRARLGKKMNWRVLIAKRDCANKQFLKEHDKMTLIKGTRGEDCP